MVVNFGGTTLSYVFIVLILEKISVRRFEILEPPRPDIFVGENSRISVENS